MRVLQYFLLATTATTCLGLAPASPVRADTTLYGSTGVVTAVLERSYVNVTSSVNMTSSLTPSLGGRSAPDVDQPSAGGVAGPAPLPGLLLFAVTGLAYLWHWRSKHRERSPRTLA